MIKVTVNHEGKEKDLFLWLTARENGKNKLSISVTINETEALAMERMHTHTERKWHYIIGVEDENLFDGSRKFEKKIEDGEIIFKDGKPVIIEVDNPIRTKVLAILEGKGFRKLYHELFKGILAENKSIIKTEILL